MIIRCYAVIDEFHFLNTELVNMLFTDFSIPFAYLHTKKDDWLVVKSKDIGLALQCLTSCENITLVEVI